MCTRTRLATRPSALASISKRTCRLAAIAHAIPCFTKSSFRPQAPALIASVGANYQDVLAGSQCLNGVQINDLFAYTLGQARTGAQADVSGFAGLCTCVQEVMIDMVFNMGQVPFPHFSCFLSLQMQRLFWDRLDSPSSTPSLPTSMPTTGRLLQQTSEARSGASRCAS